MPFHQKTFLKASVRYLPARTASSFCLFEWRVTIAEGKDHHCKNLPSSMAPGANCKVRRPSCSISCPKGFCQNLLKTCTWIYLLSPTHHDVETSGCVEKNGVAKRGARTGTVLAEIMHEAVFKKYVKISCMNSQQSALIDCASMTSSARCLSGPSMPATAWSKSLWAGTPQRSCIKRKSKFCT